MATKHKLTKHFTFAECVCPCCQRIKIVPALYTHMSMLERMRVKLGFPIVVTSGYRCPEHNTEINGSIASQHMLFATDVCPEWGTGFIERLRVMYREALVQEFGGIGYYSSWLHLDTRDDIARWRV